MFRKIGEWKRWHLIGLVLLVVLVGTTEATRWSGNSLKQDCAEQNGAAGIGACLGLVEGVTAHQIALQNSKLIQKTICIPEGVTTGQLMAIFEKYMEDNPEELHLRGSLLVYYSVTEAFPCK